LDKGSTYSKKFPNRREAGYLMTANNRLWLIAALIILSAGYALLVKKDPGVAAAIASGYVAILLTGVALLNLWKKP